jgi:tetratricopeptide (TPR) repeat protein
MPLNADLTRGWSGWIFATALFAASEMLLSAPALSQSQNWEWCAGQNNPAFDQRIAACTAIIETESETASDRAKALGYRGVAHSHYGNQELANRDYEESFRLDSASSSAHRIRGNWYRLKRNIDGAFAEYDEAVRLDPADALAVTSRGLLHLDRRDYDRALADFDEAIRLDSKLSIAYTGRAAAHQGRGDTSQAFADHDEAVRLSPAWAVGYYQRGIARSAQKDHDRAIADFDEAIRLNPRYGPALMARAAAHRAKGNNNQAVADYDQVIQLDPRSPGAFYGRGVARYLTKDYDAAIADFGEAIRLNPRFSLAFTGRGLTHRAKGNVPQAISDYDQAIQLDSKSAIAFRSRGNAFSAQRQYDRAIADFSTAIELDPKYAPALVGRGLAYREKGNLTQALADYDQAIQTDPGLAVAYGNRCGDRVAAGQDLRTALADCNESLRLQPIQTLAFTNRGFIHLKLGSTAQAMADFDAALANDAKHAWSLYGRGLAKWRKGDAPGAEADIKAASKSSSGIARSVTKYYGVAAERGLASRVAVAYAEEHPMIFAVAQGPTDVCGPGCSEWIVADGAFDKGIEKRFRSFLGTLKGRKLPIFFNSTGGSMNQSYLIGRILRERKMIASVGATLPDSCRVSLVMDETCRESVRTSAALKAQLRTNGAFCHSACVYALMGGADRQIPAGALVGVHAPISAPPKVAPPPQVIAEAEARLHAARRRYASQMGVDPDLVELADKTPHASLHILTRDEIVRFRMETPRK